MSPVDRDYPRDLVGYGRKLPHAQWPGGARIALQISLAYEAGGEASILHGDSGSEGMLTDIGFPAVAGQRSIHVEGSFDYGSRRGIWRLLQMFEDRGIRVGVLAVVMGLVRNPEVARAMVAAGHEIVSHGWRWIDYQDVPEEVEREHIRLAVEGIERERGEQPVGWMTGRPGPNTRRLVVEEGGFLYDRDALDDEVPYWVEVSGKPHLVIPYSYETNDNRFNENSGFNTADDFFQYMRDAFDVLYAEGADEPKIMSLGIHDRLVGRPAKSLGLARFLDHVLRHDKVWICTGEEIARRWMKAHPHGATA